MLQSTMHMNLVQKPEKKLLAPHAAGGSITDLMRDATMAMRLLALASTDIFARDPTGWDALTWAARNGRTECLRILLQSHDCAELIATALDPSTERPLGFEAAIEGGRERCAYLIAKANLCIHERREAEQISAAAPESGSESNAGRPRI